MVAGCRESFQPAGLRDRDPVFLPAEIACVGWNDVKADSIDGDVFSALVGLIAEADGIVSAAPVKNIRVAGDRVARGDLEVTFRRFPIQRADTLLGDKRADAREKNEEVETAFRSSRPPDQDLRRQMCSKSSRPA